MNTTLATLSKSSFFIFFIAFISCGNNLKLKKPIFKREFNQVIQEIGSTGSFSDVSFKLSTNQTNNENPSYELELKLINGQSLPNSEHGLDSLAKNAATILKNSIQNINDYDWISVIFENRNNAVVIETTKKNVFVYRPSELK